MIIDYTSIEKMTPTCNFSSAHKVDSNHSTKSERNSDRKRIHFNFFLVMVHLHSCTDGGSSPVKLTFRLLCLESEKVKLRTFKADEINIQTR